MTSKVYPVHQEPICLSECKGPSVSVTVSHKYTNTLFMKEDNEFLPFCLDPLMGTQKVVESVLHSLRKVSSK